MMYGLAGLYGKLVPVTVNNFLTAIQTGSLTGTTFSRISPGEYIQAGRQGSKRLGEVEVPAGLQVTQSLQRSAYYQYIRGNDWYTSGSMYCTCEMICYTMLCSSQQSIGDGECVLLAQHCTPPGIHVIHCTHVCWRSEE